MMRTHSFRSWTTWLVGLASLGLGCTTPNPADTDAPTVPPEDAPRVDAPGADVPGTDAPRPDTGPLSPGDFDERCAASDVVRCVGFDAPGDLAGTWGDDHGSFAGATVPSLDTEVYASGGGALRFDLPALSAADTSGSWFTNFSDDLSVQFDGGDTFYVQWRQRFTASMIETEFAGANGWKQLIVGSGDLPGCSPATAVGGGPCTSSCTALELVVQNTGQRRFPQLYNSCTGSTSHGAYTPFEEPFGSFDFLLQNAREAPYCLYSQDETTRFPPAGNCFGYVADEWMTFQLGVELGARVGDEFVDSRIQLWGARQGSPSELLVDFVFNLTAGTEGERYGKVWLLPYNTGRDAGVAHPTGTTWYDELIVSRARIADPR